MYLKLEFVIRSEPHQSCDGDRETVFLCSTLSRQSLRQRLLCSCVDKEANVQPHSDRKWVGFLQTGVALWHRLGTNIDQ